MRLSRRAPLMAVPIVAVLLGGCGAGSTAPSPSVVRASAAVTTPPPTQPAKPTSSAIRPASAAKSPASLPVAPGAGALPQTPAFPSAKSAAFRHAMTDLFHVLAL